jgi:hypothetical protein
MGGRSGRAEAFVALMHKRERELTECVANKCAHSAAAPASGRLPV